jgi:hypothetical protein
MENSTVHYPSSSARILGELHGVRLVNGRQHESTLVEDPSADSCGSHPKISSNTGGTDLEFPWKQDLPVWKTMWDTRPSWLKIMQCPGCGQSFNQIAFFYSSGHRHLVSFFIVDLQRNG